MVTARVLPEDRERGAGRRRRPLRRQAVLAARAAGHRAACALSSSTSRGLPLATASDASTSPSRSSARAGASRSTGEDGLARVLRRDDEARARFRRSVAISHGAMFRDPEQFTLLEEVLLPRLLAGGKRAERLVGGLLRRRGAAHAGRGARADGRARALGPARQRPARGEHRARARRATTPDDVRARMRWERRDVVADGPPPGHWRLDAVPQRRDLPLAATARRRGCTRRWSSALAPAACCCSGAASACWTRGSSACTRSARTPTSGSHEAPADRPHAGRHGADRRRSSRCVLGGLAIAIDREQDAGDGRATRRPCSPRRTSPSSACSASRRCVRGYLIRGKRTCSRTIAQRPPRCPPPRSSCWCWSSPTRASPGVRRARSAATSLAYVDDYADPVDRAHARGRASTAGRAFARRPTRAARGPTALARPARAARQRPSGRSRRGSRADADSGHRAARIAVAGIGFALCFARARARHRVRRAADRDAGRAASSVAAARVSRGELDVDRAEGRGDEVGRLGGAVQRDGARARGEPRRARDPEHRARDAGDRARGALRLELTEAGDEVRAQRDELEETAAQLAEEKARAELLRRVRRPAGRRRARCRALAAIALVDAGRGRRGRRRRAVRRELARRRRAGCARPCRARPGACWPSTPWPGERARPPGRSPTRLGDRRRGRRGLRVRTGSAARPSCARRCTCRCATASARWAW